MKKFGFNLTALFFLALTLRSPAWGQVCAFVDSISHFPTQPSTQDSIIIDISGWFGDCWVCARNQNFDGECTGMEVLDSFRVSGNTIYIYSSARDDKPADSTFVCVALAIPLAFQIKLGPLAAGDYGIISLMYHNSFRKPSPLVCSSGFTVSGSSPCVFSRGDMNNDTAFTAADVVELLNCVFQSSGNCHPCISDVNCDGELHPADVVLEMNKVFLNQSFPC